jgi:subtilase family serine protease
VKPVKTFALALPLVFAAFSLGCDSGGGGGVSWEPVAGTDASAVNLTVPVLYRGETHTITMRIKNNGTDTISDPFEVRLELFEDASHTVAFCAPLVYTCSEELVSGQTLDVPFDLDIDISVAAGLELYLVATVDALDDLDEVLETNNERSAAATVLLERMPDLQVFSMTVPAQMQRGEVRTIYVLLYNPDTGTAAAPFFVDLSESVTGWTHQWEVTNPVAPGATITLETQYTVSSSATPGSRTFTATADATNALTERDETNNVATATSEIVTLDFELLLIAYPPEYFVGEWHSYTIRVANLGTGTTPATTVSVYVTTDLGAPHIADLTPFNVPALAPGANFVHDYSLFVQSSYVDRLLLFHVDYNNAVPETAENNNYDGIHYLP